MYHVGDLICYGDKGVCRVADIAEQDFSGTIKGKLYYTLRPLDQDGIIYTPVDNEKVFMRPVISKEEAEKLIDMIPSIQAEPYHSKVINQLAEHYNASIKTHDCVDLIELTMSLYAKKQEVKELKRKFGVVDERFMKRAEELLFSELAVALDIPKDKVSVYIESRVGDLGHQRKETCDDI